MTEVLAPELDVVEWCNSPGVTLEHLRGRVVLLEAFQMLCPGCVSHGLPQAKRARAAFDVDDVAVIGLHTVFEHHDAMGPVALRAFLHEYRIDFPVGIDRHEGGDPLPVTMRRYQLQGTPSTVLIDHRGRIRAHAFGAIDDLVLGAQIGQLVAEKRAEATPTAPTETPEPSGLVACCPGAECT